jgi:hypothetical protein
VGSELFDWGGVSRTGAAQVYSYSSGTSSWILMGNTIAGLAGQKFGSTVSISDDGLTVAVGSSNANFGSIYSFNGSNWTTTNGVGNIFQGSSVGISSYYGYAMRMSGDAKTLVVPVVTYNGSEGIVFFYRYYQGSWAVVGSQVRFADSAFYNDFSN